MQPDIALVIPAYNEAALLPRLLRSVADARIRFDRAGGRLEVIVADNNSTDQTAEVARSHGCCVTHVERRVIAAARNGGARVARAAAAQILAFVDADTQVHPDTFVRIAEVMSSGHCIAGASGWKFERTSAGLKATEAATRLIMRIFKVDGGVVFCERSAFDAIGGYDEDRDVGEDVHFLLKMRRLARSRGAMMRLGIGTPATISTRKWDEHGDWHMFLMACWPLIQRRTFHAVVRDYWYRERL
jgi:glycosyltransferase involved in cell wall biosynthesis